MTNEILSSVVAREVEKAFSHNEKTFIKSLTEGLTSNDYVDPVTARLVIKSMHLTAQMTVQLTIRILEAYDCIKSLPDGAPELRLIEEERNE